MRMVWTLLGFLLLGGTAQAQNCPVPNTFINGTIIDANQVNANFSALTNCSINAVHVATNAALAASASTTYPHGVWRDDFSAGFGAPPVFYENTGTVCSHPDNGAQVSSSDGKCWVAAFPTAGADAREWGVKFDGATDNSTALQAAFSWFALGNVLAIPAGGGCALHSTAITVTLAATATNATIVGPKADLACLGYTGSSGTGITITYNNSVSALNGVTLTDWTYCTTHAGAANGLALTQSAAVPTGSLPFNRVGLTFRGCDGYAQTDYWTTAMVVTGVSQIDFRGLFLQGPSTPTGTGIQLVNGGSPAAVVYNFPGVTAYDLTTGISIGANIQGVAVTAGSNFVTVGRAIDVTSGTGTDQLTVSDSQFNCTAICIHSAGADVFVHDNYFILGANSAIGVYFSGTNNAVVRGNAFRNGASFTGQVALRFDATDITKGITVVGNVAHGLANSVFIGAVAEIAMFVSGNAWGTAPPLITAGATITWDQPLPFADVTPPAATVQFIQQFSDSTTTTWGATIAGGGANGVLGYSDGSNWTVMAK